MGTTNAVLITLVATNVLISVVGFAAISLAILLLSKDVTKIPEIINRLINIELITAQLADDVNMEINDADAELRWKTADGKYQGSSFEELLHKMSSDPNGPLSADEIDAIKSVFDKITQQPNNNENNEPDEPWKRK